MDKRRKVSLESSKVIQKCDQYVIHFKDKLSGYMIPKSGEGLHRLKYSLSTDKQGSK